MQLLPAQCRRAGRGPSPSAPPDLDAISMRSR
eukprot:CAMPEP_0119358850 /NCGR_PEP_ID=MMETSP1334-20130426/6919_1 /TAXON_ID=127549 /ORGANISM="Calcidiscus leptoporus, Strain RCC1130" /LENGTH=31 /DNA_ID= /DNA_START= /DNA_END= /DNA_ORIENTATION=